MERVVMLAGFEKLSIGISGVAQDSEGSSEFLPV